MRRSLLWAGLLLTVWSANGLPFDLLRLARLIPLPVDGPGLATRTLALAAAVVLARLVLARPAAPASTRAAGWYGCSSHTGIATWVFALFYGSWLLWAVAAGAATRSYQLRSAA
jgi:hypothetical protein